MSPTAITCADCGRELATMTDRGDGRCSRCRAKMRDNERAKMTGPEDVEALVEQRVAVRLALIQRLAPETAHRRALDEIRVLLTDLQRELGSQIGRSDNAWMLQQALDATSYRSVAFQVRFQGEQLMGDDESIRQLYRGMTTAQLHQIRRAFELELAKWRAEAPSDQRTTSITFAETRLRFITIELTDRKD